MFRMFLSSLLLMALTACSSQPDSIPRSTSGSPTRRACRCSRGFPCTGSANCGITGSRWNAGHVGQHYRRTRRGLYRMQAQRRSAECEGPVPEYIPC
jgi:hypothetical protein